MASVSLQYQLPSKGGQFTLTQVPTPTPGPNEISIRTKAIALNGIDWKNRAFGIMIQEYPAVLGIDAAGTIEAVGSQVQGFQPGDEVLSLAGTDPRSGAFQEIFTVPAHFVARKPAGLSFEQAASLPLVATTAASAIAVGLGLPLPHESVDLPPTSERGAGIQSVLVLGGSSGIGAVAIQFLRLVLPAALILTTASKKHHERLLSLGADQCFERSAQDDPTDIRTVAARGAGVDAIIDTVGAAGSQPAVFAALNPNGAQLYSQVMTGVGIKAPAAVKATVVFARQVFGTPGGQTLIPGLARLVESGRVKLPTAVDVVGQGFEAIQPALDRLMKEGESEHRHVSISCYDPGSIVRPFCNVAGVPGALGDSNVQKIREIGRAEFPSFQGGRADLLLRRLCQKKTAGDVGPGKSGDGGSCSP
ncbi:hypothetical protein N7470_005280 [Penicillium chermesinum]|nr:hypothetical protein N7470_005280 [Penicillium chermesinum]